MSSRKKSRQRYLRSLIAGLLVAISMPPWGWWPLAFIGLAMFTSLELAAPNARQRFTTGFIFGLGWFFPALAWMWFLTAPGYVVGVALYASLHGLASLVVIRGDNKRSFLFLSPAAHMLIEVLRMCIPFGGVPLATLGISQVGGPLHHVASVGGVMLLSWLTWQVGALLAKRPRDLSIDRQHRRLLWALCLLVFVGSYFAPRGSDTGRDFRVVAVQGGGPQGTRAINTNPRDVVERHLAATRSIVNESTDPIDLVVWPENVIDVVDFASSVEAQEIGAEAARLDAPFAVGITEDVSREHFTNAQVIVTSKAIALDQPHRERYVICQRGLMKSFNIHAIGLIPLAGKAVKWRSRFLLTQTLTQQVGKQMVVPIPPAIGVQRHDEQAGLVQLIEDLLPSVTLQHRIAQGATQSVQDRSTKQKRLNIVGMLVQDFFNQVVLHEVMAASEGRDECLGVLVRVQRNGRQFQTRNPPFCASFQGLDLGLGKVDIAA